MFIFFKVISGDWIGVFHKLFLLRKNIIGAMVFPSQHNEHCFN